MEFRDFFQFDKFLAPFLIKMVFWIGLVLIVLGTLFKMLGTGLGQLYDPYGYSDFSLANLLLAPIAGFLLAVIWRVLCEVWIVIFSINDRLGTIAGQRAAPPPTNPA